MALDFELPSTHGKKVKLSDFRGQKNVVLAFFPAVFTGGCTKEMSGYQANFTKFEGADEKTLEAYGVLMPERGIANRATFVIYKQGKITFIEEGSAVVDITNTADARSRLAHKQ
jgi:peroxiredoxin